MKIMAPTGTAAFSINGTTLHSELKIPVNYSKEKVFKYANKGAKNNHY